MATEQLLNLIHMLSQGAVNAVDAVNPDSEIKPSPDVIEFDGPP